MDMHTEVTIKEFIDTDIVCRDIPMFRVTYRVKRGRKDYKIWLLPKDFIGTDLFPLSYKIMNNGKYTEVFAMDNRLVYSGKTSYAINLVKLANKQYYSTK